MSGIKIYPIGIKERTMNLLNFEELSEGIS